MAFEYLMAHYLLTGQLDKFALRAANIQDFDYEYMPPHYAEALLLLYSQTQQWSAYDELPQTSATMEQSERFMALLRRHKNDPQGLESAVAHEPAGTYFRYYFLLLERARSAAAGG